MQTIKLLAATFAAAAIGLTAPVAVAHDHADDDGHHQNPASSAGGTEGQRGVGGSIAVPNAGDGAERTNPYTEDAEDASDDGPTMQEITSGDRPITEDGGRSTD